jgi:CheY-like chemotaxis protein
MSRLLKRKGYEVDYAVDGEEGLAMALANPPDLILMDISLPLMDGNETTRRLRKETSTKDLPIIALTAHAMTSDRELSMESGCTDFETKPVEFSRLLMKIETHLAGRTR